MLKTVRATSSTKVSVLGQSDELVEYRPELKPRSTVQQQTDGLHVRVMRAQRLRDSDAWPYPTVIQLTDIEEAFRPPTVMTLPPTSVGQDRELHGRWVGAAETPGVRFSFDYRLITGEDTQSRLHGWQTLASQAAERPGEYTVRFHPESGERYEVRAVLHHPLLTLYGEPVIVP